MDITKDRERGRAEDVSLPSAYDVLKRGWHWHEGCIGMRGLLPWGAPGAAYGLMALGSGGGRFLRAHPPRQPCPPPPSPSLGIRSAKNPLDTTRAAVA